MKPLVSVVIPTYRRPELLGRCLEAMKRQRYARTQFEVVVVDDGNDAETRALVEAVAEETRRDKEPLQVRYLGQPVRRGPAAARNRGCREARGWIVGFTDDDCIPAEDWILNALDAFVEGADVVSGKLKVPISERPTDYERTAAFMESAEFVTANCFCLRSALEQVGGFEESFDIAWREDSDFQFKCIKCALRIVRRNDVQVEHPVRPTAWWACLKDEQKNRYDALLYKRHPDLFRERIPTYGGLVTIYYVIVLSFLLAMLATLAELEYIAFYGMMLWSAFTLVLIIRRLWGTTRSLSHLVQVMITSLVTPFLSVYWRLYGAFKYRTFYW